MTASKNSPQLNVPKVIRAWCLYDWANSVYSLVIISAIFPVYYKAVTTSETTGDMVSFLGFSIQNSVLYSYALSFSFLLVAAMLPLVSGVADYTGKKKMFMKIFVGVGAFGCLGLYFFEGLNTLEWGIFCSIIASIGFSGSLVFYDAFLPEIVTPDLYDSTSARGYSMGYYGSVLLLVVCLGLILNFSAVGFSTEGDATRFAFLLVGCWWIGFSMISFRALPENPYGRKPTGDIWSNGYNAIINVWKNLNQSPDLKRFLAAFFFYNMGVQTIMYLATLFGTDVLHLESAKLIGTILLIQLVAAFGAWLFARVSKTYGNRKALLIMISIWMGICLAAYFINTEIQFYAVAVFVGIVMGGIQSLSRATYSKLIPSSTIDHASYFSFYDVTYNLSIVFGTFSFGLINQITGDMRNSALALASYFVIGFIILATIKSKKLLPISST